VRRRLFPREDHSVDQSSVRLIVCWPNWTAYGRPMTLPIVRAAALLVGRGRAAANRR